MRYHSIATPVKLRRSTIALVIRLFIVGTIVVFAAGILMDASVTLVVGAQRTGQRSVGAASRQYDAFSHTTDGHRKECASCHSFPSSNWKTIRSGDGAFPDVTDFPKHESCLNCHRQQFFSGRPPQICSICHQMTSPEGGIRYPFRNPRELYDKGPKASPRESAFAVFFPHDKHVGIVSESGKPALNGVFLSARLGPDETSCAVCHSTIGISSDADDGFISAPPKKWGARYWPKAGTLKSSPTGHQQCFTCHTPESGMSPVPADCAVCHKPRGPMPRSDIDPQLPADIAGFDREMRLISGRRIASGKFRHGFAMHADLPCSTCHAVESIKTLEAEAGRVTIAACVMCHVTGTAADGGGLNTENARRKGDRKFDCSMCHISFGRLPVPESHKLAVTGN